MKSFNPECRCCPRLHEWLCGIRERFPDYHAAPVPAFGDKKPRLLIIGLAPGMHGANRTGRPFTGDHAGILLYRTLFELGLSNQPESVSADDGLRLHGVRITNAVKCLPPQNKPTGDEIRTCNRYLARELDDLDPSTALLALGRIAHDAVLRALGLRLRDFPFAHAAQHTLPQGRTLVDSYHCSRYNTQTGRLTRDSFLQAVKLALRAGGMQPSNI
ncbi:MAG: uracil-DNA glycosylase [Zetaproteobacteria bacterium]|nr:MAG: uracil-DNA glycosylase [Zetaproteobacteria bacterium]